MPTVLIIDDEKDLVEALSYNLEKEGFQTIRAFDGFSGLTKGRTLKPSIIVLDLMLPNISGIDICKKLKSEKETADIPIIILTAKGDETDKILGLELGADDYVTKPFSIRELISRIKVILKRYSKKPAEAVEVKTEAALKFKNLEIIPDRHKVKIFNKEIEFTAKEFALLRFLAKNKGRVFGRERLLDEIWGMDIAVESRTVDVHVRRVREKLGKCDGYLHTIRGVGYKFED